MMQQNIALLTFLTVKGNIDATFRSAMTVQNVTINYQNRLHGIILPT